MPPARRSLSRSAPAVGPPRPPREAAPRASGPGASWAGPLRLQGALLCARHLSTQEPKSRAPLGQLFTPFTAAETRAQGGGLDAWEACPELALTAVSSTSLESPAETPPGLTPKVRTESPGPLASVCPRARAERRRPRLLPLLMPRLGGGYAQYHGRVPDADGREPQVPNEPRRGAGLEPTVGLRMLHGVPQTKAAHHDQPLPWPPCPVTPKTQGQGRPESWETGLAEVQAGHVSPVTPASPAQPPHGSLRDVEPAVGGRECVQTRLIRGCHSVPMATAAELVFQDRLRLGLSCQNTHYFRAGYLGDPGGKDAVGKEGRGWPRAQRTDRPPGLPLTRVTGWTRTLAAG